MAGDDLDDAGDEVLADELVLLDEALNRLSGRSRRHAAELAAILARLEQLKVEVCQHQAKLASARRYLHLIADPEPSVLEPADQPDTERSEAA
ncbi:MAG TPA: hypothetical protein DGG94_17570 [Micromonosporaceae bacterium]|nr:hypothetical protein [Micromonosporaceae bacterium]HCU51580.1 hypothetical protein [Micromonosporaceae bacterium]